MLLWLWRFLFGPPRQWTILEVTKLEQPYLGENDEERIKTGHRYYLQDQYGNVKKVDLI